MILKVMMIVILIQQIIMQGLISNLIRPFRFRYSPFDLGPRITPTFQRTDSTILNDRGLRLHYSYYRNTSKISQVCLVYAHCNSGCRIEGLQFVKEVVEERGWNLCLFDFGGSGISDGEYISLGYYQWMDLQAIVSVVLANGNRRVQLWGRSMGAATIILYLAETKQIDSIVSCVLDSPYCSLWRVIKQFGKTKTKIPQFIIEHVMEYLRNSIISTHNFDIKSLDLLKKIPNIDLPIMFIASTSDSFVSCSHAAQLYKWAPSKQKVLEYIQKQHNSPRETTTLRTGLAFMERSLVEKEENRRELRILSKKKEMCRRMTGNNMAELITKPVKDSNGRSKTGTLIKNQVHSTGNLGRFNSFCLNATSNITGTKINLQQNGLQSCQNSPRKPQKPHPDPKKPTNLNKNPHKIQQSIIKLALPPKQMLQHIHLQDPVQNQQHKENMRLNRENNSNTVNMVNINLGEIGHGNGRGIAEKENNFNVSNKSRQSQQESGIKLSSKINNFESIITRRFHFQGQNEGRQQQNMVQQQPQQLNIDNLKLKQKDIKCKTQKINIFLRNTLNSSPSRKKAMGIKLINKMKTKEKIVQLQHKQKQQQKQKQKDRKKANKKSRVKTQITTIHHYVSSSPQAQNQHAYYCNSKQRLKTNDPHSSSYQNQYQQISLQEKQPIEKRWICGGGASLCKMGVVDTNDREIYMNKYRDRSQNERERERHKISCDENWMSREQSELGVEGKRLEVRHFQSIGELPTSTDVNDHVAGKGGLLNTQKIIKIQLDRNLFHGGKKKQTAQNAQPSLQQRQLHNRKDPGPSTGAEHKIRRPSIQLPSPGIEMNPILSKFKLKNKRILNPRDREQFSFNDQNHHNSFL